MLVGNVSPAYAQTDIIINNSGTGSDTWTYGYANTSYLHTEDNDGDSENYTDWVQGPLNDKVTMTGGSLTTNGLGLNGNGVLEASGGAISVQSGTLTIGTNSYINSGANLTLGTNATLAQTGGNVTLNSGDSIDNGYISATSGNLSFTGGTHTIKNGSNIANSLSITGGTVTFANADSLNTSLANSASVSFNGGTLDNNITDTGSTTFNNTVTNTGYLQQNFVANNGTLTNNGTIKAGLANSTDQVIKGTGSIITGTGTSANNGTIAQNSLTNNGTFTSNGQVTLANGLVNNATFNNNALLLASATNTAGSTLNSDPDDLGDDVANNGTLNLNADGTLAVEVTGTGTTNINGDLLNASSISQKDVTVASGKVVTTNASDITATDKITNDGTIHYTGGTTGNTIEGTGRVDITGYVTNTGDITQNKVTNSGVFTNDGTVTANLTNTNEIEGTGSITTGTGISSNSGTITQNALTNNGTFDNTGHITLAGTSGTLTNNGTFNTNADLIAASGGVTNAGNFNITGGTNATAITGANGITNFSNTVVNEAAITQAEVTNSGNLTNNAVITADVTNTGVLTSEGDKIVGDIDNYGTYVISDGDNANDIIGEGGTLSILGDTANTGTIMQETLTVANSGSLTTDSDLVIATVTNDGKLEWNAGTANENVINGTGELHINGADVVNSSAISQGNIKVVNGSLTSNADLLTSSKGITNNDGLTFTGGTNTNAITGSGDLTITGDVTNSATINQDIVTVSSGKLTTAADTIATANGVVNNSEISFTSGDNNNDISGTGTTYIDGTVQNLASIDTVVQVNTGAHYGTAADVLKKLENRGTTDLIDADIASTGKISGTGVTNILGATVNNSSISQSAVNIAAGGSLTTASDKVEAEVINDGKLEWNAGSVNSNVISGTGQLDITGGTIANTAAISQNKIEITGGTLATNADLLATVGGINNDATLGFSGGTNKNVITGNGNLTTANDVTNSADITQNSVTVFSGSLANSGTITADVTVNSGAVLASEGDDITGDITNNGTYAISNGDNDNDITGSTGSELHIYGNTRNTGVINQDTLKIVTGATFVATDMDDVTAANIVDNEGTFEMQSGTNNNVIAGSTGILKVTGDVTNASGASIIQDKIDISTLGVFKADASNVSTIDGISNSGTLEFNNGTNTNDISGTGNLSIVGTVANSGNISQETLTNTGTFTSNADLLAFAQGINNQAALDLTGGTNANAISGSGAGTITFTGDVTNNAAIDSQASVSNSATLTNNEAITAASVVNSGTIDNSAMITGPITNTGTINSIADDLNGIITNNGTLNVAGGTVTNSISGSGNMNITADLVNAQNINQATVVNDGTMTNSGAITVSASFTNNGVVDNTAAITGAVTNTGTINSTATNLVGTVNNTGTLNLDGGTTQGAILGAGDTNITAVLTNNYAINQTNVTNTAALTNNAAINVTTFTNNDTVVNDSTITATDITNSGTITSKASDLVASNEIANEGTLVFNAASTGASNISGTGDVQVTADTTLTGSNSFSGGTLIDGANLTVAGQNNLGTGNVTFDNDGVLVVTAADALDNNLRGLTDAKDVTVENAAALTLNGSIDNAADFHKVGAGAMTFAMAANGYTGTTYLDEGTLIGNTGNINNLVRGASGTTVDFTDTTDAELNEINTAGTFVKSGAGLLNVETNAFTANLVELNNGIFAANRAITANTLNVNAGATLRGNGNIAGDVYVNDGGTIAPGNSIDTLTVSGDLNLASGSTTAIEINETPASDKLVVTGTTNIASGANLTVANENGRYFEWKEFEIINADNVTGEFTYDGTITDYDTSRIDVEVDYSDPTKVLLTAKRKATDHAAVEGLSRNQSSVARAMDAVSTGFGGDITNALLQLEQLGGLSPTGVTPIDGSATLQSALDNIGGVLYANSALATLFNAKTAHVYDRIAKRNPSAGNCATCHDNIWAEYYSQYDKVYANDNSRHFTNTMTGVLAGYDRSSDEVLLGVYGGAGKSDLRQHKDRMDIEDVSLGIYAGYRPGNWVFKGTLFGGYQNYHGKRSIDFMARTAEGKYHGMNLALDLEGGYNIALYDWLNLKPFAGVLGNYVHTKSFTETGADALNLKVESKNQFNTQARLGVQLDGKVGKRLNWYGSAAVKQFIGGDYAKLHMSLDLPGTRMEIISAELGRTYFSGQAGLSYALTDRWSVFGNLEAGVNNKSANCYGNVGLAYTW